MCRVAEDLLPKSEGADLITVSEARFLATRVIDGGFTIEKDVIVGHEGNSEYDAGQG